MLKGRLFAHFTDYIVAWFTNSSDCVACFSLVLNGLIYFLTSFRMNVVHLFVKVIAEHKYI